jgi:hypothetical protein
VCALATVQQLARALSGYADRGQIIRDLAHDLERVIPAVEEGIRDRAVDVLPGAGGLGKWVAKLRLRSSIRLGARRARVTIVGHRRSLGGTADLGAIDRGRVRHPSWGRRGPNDWHVQLVSPGFMSKSEEAQVWSATAQASVTRSFRRVTGGG